MDTYLVDRRKGKKASACDQGVAERQVGWGVGGVGEGLHGRPRMFL